MELTEAYVLDLAAINDVWKPTVNVTQFFFSGWQMLLTLNETTQDSELNYYQNFFLLFQSYTFTANLTHQILNDID